MLNQEFDYLGELGSLQGVETLPADYGQPSLIFLKFVHAILEIRAIAEDDTVELRIVNEIPERGVDVSGESPWKDAIGLEVTDRWLLSNQQGYTDAVQFRFTLTIEFEIIIQLMVSSSFFTLFSVQEKKWVVGEKPL